MKTLKVEEVYWAGYQTFANVATSLAPIHRRDLHSQKPARSPRIPIARGLRNPTRPRGGLGRMAPRGQVRKVHSTEPHQHSQFTARSWGLKPRNFESPRTSKPITRFAGKALNCQAGLIHHGSGCAAALI